MGLTVEHAIVIGIFVVIVAILGIAISGAMGSDGSLFGAPQGVVVAAEHDGGGQAPVVLRDSDEQKRSDALRRRQEMVRRRDAALRLMEGEGAGGDVARAEPAPSPPKKTPPGVPADAPAERPTALKRGAVGTDGADREPAEPAYTDYAIADGDTVWTIVRKHYGEGDVSRIVDFVLESNPTVRPDQMKAGETVLRLPTELPEGLVSPPVLKKSAPSVGASPSNSTDDHPKYEVQPGDSLRRIAQRELGESSRWEEIYELNRAYVPAPDDIHVGQTLLMPKR